MTKDYNFKLRYTNCWEDAQLLTDILSQYQPRKIASIASGADNSLSIIAKHPEELYVIDINPLQLYLFELKYKGILGLDKDEYLCMTGYNASNDRIQLYQKVASSLSNSCRKYWDNNLKLIERGLIHQGYAERNMKKVSWFFRTFIHNRQDCEALIKVKSQEAQQEFYNQQWNNWKWRSFMNITFHRNILKHIAPDPDFFNYIKSNTENHVKSQTKNHLQTTLCQQNPFLNYFLLGDFKACLPHYLQDDNYELIKISPTNVTIHEGFIESCADKHGSMDAFNLSNIFEYTTESEFYTLSETLAAQGNDKAVYIYWNLMTHRMLHVFQPELYSNIINSEVDYVEDRGWIYKRMVVDRKINKKT